MTEEKRISIFDTTLRDGEQSSGISFNPKEKTEIAKQLVKLNVDVIEAGFPVSSPNDFKAVQRIAQEIEGPAICALARAKAQDINKAWEAIKGARKPIIHTFVGTSNVQLSVLRKKRAQVLEMAVEAVQQAKGLCKEVEFSPMDATQTDIKYLYEIIQATIEAGATIINIPDTVGYAVPGQINELIIGIMANVPNIYNVKISVHCHNDLGMAVANSLLAIEAGAEQIECTINGIGERAGNAALEEIVMAIKTRHDYYNARTDIVTEEIMNTSRLVSRVMGFMIPPNKAIVGKNAFSHSSGIHQDGMLKNRRSFEIMRPEDVGAQSSQFELTSKSGRHALRHKFSEMGYELSGKQLNMAYEEFLKVVEKKRQIFEEDLRLIIDELSDIPQVYSLESISYLGNTGNAIKANVCLGYKKETLCAQGIGNGLIDAIYQAIDKIVGVKIELLDYSINAATEGKDAVGEALVRVKYNKKIIIGRGASTDVFEASAKAYINAINKIMALEQKGGDESLPSQIPLPLGK